MSVNRKTSSATHDTGCESGFVLVSALGLIVLLTLLGVGGLLLADLEVRSSGGVQSSTEAFYLAEAGVQRAMVKLTEDPNWLDTLADPNDAFAGENTLGRGTYTVEVIRDDPDGDAVRVRSTGTTNGFNASSATVEVVASQGNQYYGILQYAALSCGNLSLLNGDNEIRGGDLFVDGNLTLEGPGVNKIENGSVFVTGNVQVAGDSRIRNGNLFSNGGVGLNSSASPNVYGNVAAGGKVTGPGLVLGTVTEQVSPPPVTNTCQGVQLAESAVTTEAIESLRANADTTIDGSYTLDHGTIEYSGVVHITRNLELRGRISLTNHVIFIVDGNVSIQGPGVIESTPRGATVTILVPTGNFSVSGSGEVEIDGFLQVGTVQEDGNNIQGGNFRVTDVSMFAVNGTVAALNGNFSSDGQSRFQINWAPPQNELLSYSGGDLIIRDWRELPH